MIGIIILISLLICALCLLIALLYIRQTEIEVKDKSVDLESVLPIQAITENAVINGNGDITVGYRLLLPEVFTLSESEAQYIHERLEALLKLLPAGTVIHQQNFYYTGRYHHAEYSSNALIAENNRHFNGKEILNSYTNLYVTFTNGSRNGKIRKSASGTSLMRKLHYPFKQPYKEYQQRLTEMEAFLMNFENGLSSIQQFEIRKMDDTELNNAIYDYVNLSYETPENDATQKSVNPMAVSESGSMKIGQQHVSILSLTNEGEHLQELAVPHTGKSKAYGGNIEIPDSIRSKCSMLYPVGLGLPFNHIVNIVIEITDPDATVTAIGAEKDALNYITNFYPPAAEKQREQAAFCDEITQFDYQTAYTAFNVVLNDTDRTSLMRKTALVQQGFSFMNQSSCYVENAELCNLFFCNIPGNARANYRGFVNTTKQAICYLQKEGMYLSDEKGHIYHDRFGTPAKINLWDYPALNNKNRIVIGPSGSGKSFWLNNYILQSYELGRDVMIIDIGGSYRSMIALNRGKYFDSTEQKKFAFNPFLCDRDKNGKYLYIDTTDAESADDQIKTIVAIISYIWKVREPMLPAENAILRKSVIGFYDYVNNSSIGEKHERIFPTLITYRAYLKEVFSKRMTEFEKQKFEIEELLLLLEPYTDGELSFLLNATENVDIVHDRLIAFDMEDASKKEYFPLVAIITLQMIVDKIKKRQGFAKELIIDEALDFLQDEKFGDFIAYLYRTFRKKEGSITLAAQNILFLKNMPSSIKDSIIINCATKIILDHSEHRQNLPEVKAVLSITDEEAYMIESLQRTERWREFFIKMSNDAFIFRNEVSDFAAVAFDSRQATVVRLKQLFNESGSTYTAINRHEKGKCQELSDSLAGMCHIHPIIHHQQITVMKRIILILGLAASIGLMGTGSVHAQFVVHDPGHTLLNSTEWIANVKKWVTQINEMIDAQELRLGLQKIDQLKELKSLKELADLLDDVACLSSDYSFYLNVGSNYHCLKFLNFQRVTVNLSLSTDLLFKVATVTSYFSMNSEGRMSFIEQVKESVEKAAEEMREFNESVRSTVIYKSMKGHNRKTYYQGRLAAFTRHTN